MQERSEPRDPRREPGPESPPPSGEPPREPRPSGEPQPSGEGAETQPAEEGKAKKHSFWRELPVLIVIAFAVALLIKTFLLQAFYIPSASMEPTLREGDRVLVEKVAYRFGEPQRGDVVVFERDVAFVRAPEGDEPFWTDVVDAFKSLFGFPTGTAQDFIKRVIAVEGDKVEAREGTVFVNGEPVEEPYLPNGVETMPFGPVDVPPNHIFVMGDNRNNSDDSRSFGPVEADKVIGHAFVLIWPPADLATL